jgi:hypothetical protein
MARRPAAAATLLCETFRQLKRKATEIAILRLNGSAKQNA